MLQDFMRTTEWPPGRNLDFPRAVQLPDSEFAQLYLELMQQYRDHDGWWSQDKTPSCHECHKIIPSPQQLRRYKGLSMHPKCFRTFYQREGDDSGITRTYFEKVARLP